MNLLTYRVIDTYNIKTKNIDPELFFLNFTIKLIPIVSYVHSCINIIITAYGKELFELFSATLYLI